MFGPVALIGYGRFGRAFAQLLEQADVSARVFDNSAPVPDRLAATSLPELLEQAKVVILAVPVTAMESCLHALIPHLREDQIVFDVGSVKVGPEKTMSTLLAEKVPWVATHPLFGPASLAQNERPLNVVVCPNQSHPKAVAEVRRLYEHCGCAIIEQDAATHDQGMAETHALVFFLAKGLVEIGAGNDVEFTPPSFQALARAIEAVRADAGHLFFAIQHENPFAGAARRKLLDALTRIDQTLCDRKTGDGKHGDGSY